MKRRKLLLGSSALLASGAFISGSGAFSSVESEREISVAVANDKEAYLGLETDEDGEVTVGLLSAEGPFEAPQTITVGNHLTEELEVKIESDDAITLDSENDTSDSDSVRFDLGIGEYEDVEVDLKENEELDAELDITAEGDSVSVSAARNIKLEPALRIDEVIFQGAGGVDIHAISSGPSELVYWVADEIESTKSEEVSEDNSSNNHSSGSEGSGRSGSRSPGKITSFNRFEVPNFGPDDKLRGEPHGGHVAVYFPQLDTSYHHPEFNPDTNKIDNWGQGNLSGTEFEGKVIEE